MHVRADFVWCCAGDAITLSISSSVIIPDCPKNVDIWSKVKHTKININTHAHKRTYIKNGTDCFAKVINFLLIYDIKSWFNEKKKNIHIQFNMQQFLRLLPSIARPCSKNCDSGLFACGMCVRVLWICMCVANYCIYSSEESNRKMGRLTDARKGYTYIKLYIRCASQSNKHTISGTILIKYFLPSGRTVMCHRVLHLNVRKINIWVKIDIEIILHAHFPPTHLLFCVSFHHF